VLGVMTWATRADQGKAEGGVHAAADKSCEPAARRQRGLRRRWSALAMGPRLAG
jgi:hypothetical protein